MQYSEQDKLHSKRTHLSSGALFIKPLFVSAIDCSFLCLKGILVILSMLPSASEARTETAKRKGLQGKSVHDP